MHCYSASSLKQQSAYRRSSNRQIMPTQSWPVIVLESWTLMMCAQRRSSRNHVLDWSEILDLIHDFSHSMRPKTQNFIYIMERKFKVMFYNATTINQTNDNMRPLYTCTCCIRKWDTLTTHSLENRNLQIKPFPQMASGNVEIWIKAEGY